MSSIYTTQLLSRTWLAEDTFEIELTQAEEFEFLPGQHIRFFYRGLERDYSLISAPAASTISLLIRHLGHGSFSSMLASASIGTNFSFSGPHGYFLFQRSQRIPVFVATGTGLAPFVAMARSGIHGFLMLHGGRTSSDMYYPSLFKTSAEQYLPCLSRVAQHSLPEGAFGGRVTAYIDNYLHQGRYDFYLCGQQDMIRDVMFLIDERFPDSLVKTEAFF